VGISDFIMGVVFAAAGTSFPNVFASMVVARQGLGNAAISNALGGNVFNIFMGLGFPWLCYCFLGNECVPVSLSMLLATEASVVV
jgi:Ca2+/Na+ antiporter